MKIKKENIYKGDLILVNREHSIKQNISEEHLCSYSKNYPKIQLEETANKELQEVLQKICAENKIVPVSGYRSLEEQRNIYQESLFTNGSEFTKKYVAYPNCSEHQTGLAIDLAFNSPNIDFIRPAFPNEGIGKQFRKQMISLGFIERYKEEKKEITQIASEEWHFRYVGYPHSKIMEEKDLCLEEYTEYLKQFPYKEKKLCYENYEIFFVPIKKEEMIIELPEKQKIKISGNNIDGVIFTCTLQ